MSRYKVRSLRTDDFDTLMRLETTMFGRCHEGVLGPYYVRLCCDFFADSCFMVEVEGQPVGYLLSFVRGRQAYCTTLAIRPEFQGTRVIRELLKAFVTEIVDRVDTCWFTVEEGNKTARSLHAMLGAKEAEVRPDFYGAGHARIVSRIERPDFERVRPRFEKLGLLGPKPVPTVASWSEAVA